MPPKYLKRASKFKYMLYAKVSRPGKPDCWLRPEKYRKVIEVKMILNMGNKINTILTYFNHQPESMG